VRAISLGFACNNACVFCAQGALRVTEPRAGVEAVEQALVEARPGESVALVGGEPTLFEELPRWIEALGARGVASIVVQTNGRRLAYRAYAARLAATSRALRLDVSLPGSTAPMHDWHTAVAGSFSQTIAGMRSARAVGIPFGVTIVATRANYRHLSEIVRVAHAVGAAAVHLRPVADVGRAAQGPVAAPPALLAPHLARALGEARRLGLSAFEGAGPVAGFAGLGIVEPHPARVGAESPAEWRRP